MLKLSKREFINLPVAGGIAGRASSDGPDEAGAKLARALSYAAILCCRTVLFLKVGRWEGPRCACGDTPPADASRALGSNGLRRMVTG